MHRRSFLVKSSLLTASSLLWNLPQAQAADAFTPLRNQVGTFTGRGGTIGFLASDEALVVVDSQFPDTAKTCLDGLQKRSSRQIDLFFNSHHHGDHTAGNGVFKAYARQSIAHKNVPILQKKSAEQRDNLKDQVYVDTTFAQEFTQNLGAEKVSARYFGNAHTGGDSVVYFERANVAHLGDLVFNRLYPYIDRPGGAQIENWAAVLKEIAETYPQDAIYIFGHGREEFGTSGSVEDLQIMANYLHALLEVVERDIKAGKSKEEIAQRESIPGFPEHRAKWEGALQGNLNAAYEELTEEG